MTTLQDLTYEELLEYEALLRKEERDSKRALLTARFDYDTKSAYHVVRLMDEVEQILTTGDLDLTRNAAQLKEIRAGAWTEQQVRDHFAMKEKTLEEVYANSKLPYGPPEGEIKALLLECLEHHYGSLSDAVRVEGRERTALQKILELAEDGLK